MKRQLWIACAALSIAACGVWIKAAEDHKHDEVPQPKKLADNAAANEAMCDVEPTKGNQAKGHVHFVQDGDKVKVMAHITGLTPNQKHGFHIHEGTECGDDGMKAGGHFNPDKHDHGLPDSEKGKRHAGDMGNLTADKDGVAHLEVTLDAVTIGGDKANNIVGHALIVHAKPDDGGQPTGNAGGRIACGIIKAAK